MIMGWFPGLVAADCESEFYFYMWSGHCLFVYSISQGTAVNIPTVLALMALAFEEVSQVSCKQANALSRPFSSRSQSFYCPSSSFFFRHLALSESILILELLTDFQTKTHA